MKKKDTAKRPFSSLSTRSFHAGGYSVAAAVIVLAIAVAVNALVGNLPSIYTKLDTTANGLYTVSEQTEKGFSQFALNRNRPGLKLPAMEKRAVIGKGQLDIPHILNQPSEVSVENNHAGKCRGENKETCKIRKAIFHLLHPCSAITAVVTAAGHCK